NRNTIGFYGYNGGQNRTYGYLNDPALPAYESVSTGAGGGTEWSTKTFLEITGDIREMISSLRTKSGAQIDPKEVDITLAVSTGSVDYLSVTSDFGNSVQDWLTAPIPAYALNQRLSLMKRMPVIMWRTCTLRPSKTVPLMTTGCLSKRCPPSLSRLV